MIFDDGTDLLVDDLIERIVRRHVDSTKLRARLIAACRVIRAGKLSEYKTREEHKKPKPPSPRQPFLHHPPPHRRKPVIILLYTKRAAVRFFSS